MMAVLTNKGVAGGLATLDTNAKLPTAQSSAAPSFSGDATVAGDLILSAAGKGVSVKEGTNAKMGTATLSSGTATVATTAVKTTSRIMLTVQSLGTVTAPKAVAVTARTADTSFVITSADNTDTSVVAWVILTPSA